MSAKRRVRNWSVFRDTAGHLHGRPRDWLTPQQEKAIRRAWARGATQMELSMLTGLSIDVIRARLNDQLRDLPRRGRGRGSGKPAPIPGPQEIAAAAAEVRKSWTPSRWLSSNPDDESVSARHLEARDGWR